MKSLFQTEHMDYNQLIFTNIKIIKTEIKLNINKILCILITLI